MGLERPEVAAQSGGSSALAKQRQRCEGEHSRPAAYAMSDSRLDRAPHLAHLYDLSSNVSHWG